MVSAGRAGSGARRENGRHPLQSRARYGRAWCAKSAGSPCWRPSNRLEPDLLARSAAGEQHEGGVGDPIVAEPAGAAGWVLDRVEPAEPPFGGLAALFPADRYGAVEHKIGVLDPARIAAHRDPARQMNHLHAVAAGRRPGTADTVEAGESGLPHGAPLGMAHDITGEFSLARVVAVGIEGNGAARRRAETARALGVAVLWMTGIDRRLWRPAADADRHQDRPDPVVAETVRPLRLVQNHVEGAEFRLDDVVAERPADRQHAIQHQKMLDHLVRMAGSVVADRLMDQREGEIAGPERVRVVHLWRAAGADIAHLRPRQLREAAAAGKRVPIEALVGMAADLSAHLGREIGRIPIGGHCHDEPSLVQRVAGYGSRAIFDMAPATRFPNGPRSRAPAGPSFCIYSGFAARPSARHSQRTTAGCTARWST